MPLETCTRARAVCFGACREVAHYCSPKVTWANRAGLRKTRADAASVRAWSLDVVDHQHFNLAFACLQPEPKLFL